MFFSFNTIAKYYRKIFKDIPPYGSNWLKMNGLISFLLIGYGHMTHKQIDHYNQFFS